MTIAERSDTDTCDPEQIGPGGGIVARHHVAAPVDELHPDDRRRQVAEAGTGAMGRGADRAGDRLGVDVAEVRHRQSHRGELVAEIAQADPGLDRHTAGRGVDAFDGVHRVEREQHPVRHRRRGERVPGTDGLDRSTGSTGLGDDRRHLVGARRLPTATGTQVWFRAQLRTVAFAGIIFEITPATVVPTARRALNGCQALGLGDPTALIHRAGSASGV